MRAGSRCAARRSARSPRRSARRWSHARRMALALSLLRDPALDALITDSAPFDELPAGAGAAGRAARRDTLCQRIDYP